MRVEECGTIERSKEFRPNSGMVGSLVRHKTSPQKMILVHFQIGTYTDEVWATCRWVTADGFKEANFYLYELEKV